MKIQKKFLYPSLIFCCLLFIILTSSFWSERANVRAQQYTTLPNLVLASRKRLTQLIFNPQTRTYQQKGIYELNQFKAFAATKDFILVGDLHKLIELDNNLEKSNEIAMNFINSIEVEKEHIFTGAEGKLIILNRDLERIGETFLELCSAPLNILCDWSEKSLIPRSNSLVSPVPPVIPTPPVIPLPPNFKNIDDIAIDRDKAYLLSSINSPDYILIVDFQDIKNPKVIQKELFHGINQQLRSQWLEPQKNQWLILQLDFPRTRVSQNIFIYTIDRGQPIERIKIYIGQLGYFLSISKSSPAWAEVIKDNKIYVKELNYDGNEILAKQSLELISRKPQWAINSAGKHGKIVRWNDFLFVLTSFYERRRYRDDENNKARVLSILDIVDIGGEFPRHIFSQSFEERFIDFAIAANP